MQNATQPDVDRLINGGQERKRRRNVTRGRVVALALVLVGGGAYAVAQRGDSDGAEGSGVTGEPTATSDPAAPATAPPSVPLEPGAATIEPGTYRLLVGFDRTGAQIVAHLRVETRDWRVGNFPTVNVGPFVGGVGAYQTHGVAAGSGCSSDRLNTDLGHVDLAQVLASLPRSKVLQPVTHVRAFGHDASHVRIRIKDDCPTGQGYRVAETPRGSRGISYSALPTTVVVDFWVVDLGRAEAVVDTWHQSGSSADLVNQVAALRDSITFVTLE
jgi:hypothetical protein